MKTKFIFLVCVLLTIAHESPAQTPQQQQVKIITSGGFTAAFDILGPIFEQATGIKVIIEYGSSMGGGPQSIPVRLQRGENSDLLIFNARGYPGIVATGRIQTSTRTDLARSIVGMAVHSGASQPNISTMDAFIETVLAAKSIGYSASVSGTYLSNVVFPELGIWEQIRDKTTRVVGERVATVVARGEVEIGFQARSEILPIPGADYAGAIPDEIQQVSTIVAVMTSNVVNNKNARKLLDFLASEAAAPVIESTGLMPIALEKSDQVKVFTSGGFTAAFNILGPIFEEATGIKVNTEYGASLGGAPDSIPNRLARGEVADVLILNRPPLDDLVTSGYIRPDSPVDLVRSIIGMAVLSGAPKPDISTREAFIQTLLEAQSIGYSASVSGTYLATTIFPELGIWQQIQDKTSRIVTERVASAVVRGDVEIGFQQISAILPIEGAELAGTIPAELQRPSIFSAGIMKNALNQQAAEQLIQFISSESVAEIIHSTGLQPIVWD